MPPLRWLMQRPGCANARVDDTTLPALPDRFWRVSGQAATHMEDSAITVALYAR